MSLTEYQYYNFDRFRQLILHLANAADFNAFQDAMHFGDKHFPDRWNELICEGSGDTVIHLAARCGCLPILKYFKENYGSESMFTKVNIDGKTSLHTASQEGQLKCVRYLLSIGLPPDPLKKGDWTPLMLACAKGHLSIVKELVEAGADQSLKNKDGWTAFHIACRTGCLEIVTYLYNQDSKICLTKSKNNRTPLHTAALHGNYNIVGFLLNALNHQADQKDTCGSTPLMDAARGDHKDVLKLLLNCNQESGKAVDLLGRNALHIASECGSNGCVEYLVNNAAVDVNSKTCGEQTPLHFAAKEDHMKTVELLIGLGAELCAKDRKGRTAEDLAELKNHHSCAEIIKTSQMRKKHCGTPRKHN